MSALSHDPNQSFGRREEVSVEDSGALDDADCVIMLENNMKDCSDAWDAVKLLTFHNNTKPWTKLGFIF